jgi:hypothetical protein
MCYIPANHFGKAETALDNFSDRLMKNTIQTMIDDHMKDKKDTYYDGGYFHLHHTKVGS